MMRSFITFAPAIVFFAAYFAAQTYPAAASSAMLSLGLPGTGAFYAATVALMMSAVGQITLLLALRMQVMPGEWAGAVLIIIFGGITLMLRETAYLQIKTTVINWLFALSALSCELVFKKPAAEKLLSHAFDASRTVWRRATVGLASIFVIIGAVNLAVISYFSEETWVWLKTFAYPTILLVGVVGIFIYVARCGEFKHEAG